EEQCHPTAQAPPQLRAHRGEGRTGATQKGGQLGTVQGADQWRPEPELLASEKDGERAGGVSGCPIGQLAGRAGLGLGEGGGHGSTLRCKRAGWNAGARLGSGGTAPEAEVTAIEKDVNRRTVPGVDPERPALGGGTGAGPLPVALQRGRDDAVVLD